MGRIIFLAILLWLPWPYGEDAEAGINDSKAYSIEHEQPAAEPLIEGLWRFTHTVFRGMVRPGLDPDFVMEYHFEENGNSLLRWENARRQILCERRGKYIYRDGQILDEAVWLNPDNSIICGEDPDMVLGRRSITPVTVKETELILHLQLGREPFDYVWERIL